MQRPEAGVERVGHGDPGQRRRLVFVGFGKKAFFDKSWRPGEIELQP